MIAHVYPGIGSPLALTPPEAKELLDRVAVTVRVASGQPMTHREAVEAMT
jgi:hypothetical protein